MTEPREIVSVDELREALVEYVSRANASPRVARALAGWSCRVHIQAEDVEAAQFTLVVRSGRTDEVQSGLSGVPDLVVRGLGLDLAEIFWGVANPVSNYMQGAIKTQGRADDVMKLDAMAMFVFLGQ